MLSQAKAVLQTLTSFPGRTIVGAVTAHLRECDSRSVLVIPAVGLSWFPLAASALFAPGLYRFLFSRKTQLQQPIGVDLTGVFSRA